LGERLLCKQEVIGSIPFTSTISVAKGERHLLRLGMKFLIRDAEVMTLPLRFVD
jgi:hypothetical protein